MILGTDQGWAVSEDQVPPSGAATFSTWRVEGDTECHVFVVGELDMATAPQLRIALWHAFRRGKGRVVVDLAHLTYCDSSGVHAFVEAANDSIVHGCDFSLTRVQPPVKRLFELTGLCAVLHVA
jgi:anti-sigma B factor antagonist